MIFCCSERFRVILSREFSKNPLKGEEKTWRVWVETSWKNFLDHFRTWPRYVNICLGSYLSAKTNEKTRQHVVRLLVSETWAIGCFLLVLMVQSGFGSHFYWFWLTFVPKVKKMKNLFDFERSKKWWENHSRTWPWYENICLGSYLSKQLKNKLTWRLVRVLMSETWLIDDFLPFKRIQSDFERISWIK